MDSSHAVYQHAALVLVMRVPAIFLMIAACAGPSDTGHADSAVSVSGGVVSVANGRWREVSAGQTSLCAVSDDDGSVWCGPELSAPTFGELTGLSVRGSAACGIDVSGIVQCWGSSRLLDDLDRGNTFPTPTVQVSIDNYVGCAVADDRSVVCRGEVYISDPPAGLFRVSASTFHACGLDSTGSVRCWGYPINAPVDPTAASAFVDVAAALTWNCAGGPEGVICWPWSSTSETIMVYDRGITSLDLNQDSDWPQIGICWVSEGQIGCADLETGAEGPSYFALSALLAEYRFQAVAVGRAFVCGITTEAELVCSFGQSDWIPTLP